MNVPTPQSCILDPLSEPKIDTYVFVKKGEEAIVWGDGTKYGVCLRGKWELRRKQKSSYGQSRKDKEHKG